MAFNPSAPRDAAYPNQRRANDPLLNEVIKASVSFWAGRGVNVSGVPVDVADDVSDPGQPFVGGRGFKKDAYGNARLVLSSHEVGMRLKRIRSKRLTAQERRQQLLVLGEIVAHELGHAGGLNHTATGLMSPFTNPKNTPYEIKQLANRLIRNKRAKKSGPVRGGEETF